MRLVILFLLVVFLTNYIMGHHCTGDEEDEHHIQYKDLFGIFGNHPCKNEITESTTTDSTITDSTTISQT